MRLRCGAAFLVILTSLGTVSLAQTPRWVAAWATAHNARETTPPMSGKTLRMVVRPTASGIALRVRLENTMGRAPVTFASVFIGPVDSKGSLNAAVNARVTFGNARSFTLAAGAIAWSDAVPIHVEALDRFVVSLDVASSSDASIHTLGLASNVFGAGGHAADASTDGFQPIPDRSYYWVAGVDVLSSDSSGAIVAFGDSWVDGRCSGTIDGVDTPDLYRRWIDVLSERLASQPPGQRLAVVNEGIAGDRILVANGNGPSTLERLQRDVLQQSGATHAFLLQGMNDLGAGASAEAVTAGMGEIIDRVHAAGMRVIGGTLFALADPQRARWTVSMEAQRQAVNRWIRSSGRFDGIVDFDRMMSGPPRSDGRVALPGDFQCNDFVHPNAAGYRAMGEFIDLGLFAPAASGSTGGSTTAR